MPKLISFNFISLDGYYKGPNEDISWNKPDPEWNEYAIEGAKSGSRLVFGRVTYQMMASYWPTALAAQNNPGLAPRMNDSHKIVFSRTLEKTEWNNTTLIKDDMPGAIRQLKQNPGTDMTILGSGTIVTQLAGLGLIDEFQIMLIPVAIGNGTPLFKGINHKLNLKLKSTRTFKNGNVLLCYEP